MLSDEQIKHMVIRFLCWRLPESFNPDGGISFEKTYNENTPWPMTHEPVGTNLFDYTQAEAMVRFMLEGLPVGHQAEAVAPYKFHRFVDGVEMAEDVEINSASSVEEAFRKARAFYGNPKGMDLVLETASPAPAVEPVGIKALREAAENVVNFAWSAVVTDCTESADYLNELITELRSALVHLTPTPVSAPVGVVEMATAALEGLIECHDAFNASYGNMEDAYYKLAKYAYPKWHAARDALAALRSPAVESK